MVDKKSVQYMPPGLMDLLRIFLAFSSRGEEAVLDLETRKKAISKKFRRDEKSDGVPAAPFNITFSKKKKNPARASRSCLRLEVFGRKMRRSLALLLKISPTQWSSSWTRRRTDRTGLRRQALPAPFLK